MGLFSKSKEEYKSGVSSALFTIYFVTVVVAATAIIPGEEKLISGLLKSLLWPFYLVTKLG